MQTYRLRAISRSAGVKCVFVALAMLSVSLLAMMIPKQISPRLPPPQPPREQIGSLNIQRNQTLPKQGTSSPSKVTHIGFLKVHKAASSTMQNVFFRFGLKHNLSILTPRKGYFFYGTESLPEEWTPGTHYDILAVHSIYNKDKFAKVLHPDAAYIGIVREPLERMVSAAHYFRDVPRTPHLTNLPDESFIKDLIDHPNENDKGVFSRTRNAMGKDFGFSDTLKPSDSQLLQQKVDQLKKEFLLVLVVEMFDESLVLMRRYLNWSMYDIIYLKVNTYNHTTVKLSLAEKVNFRSTCFMDYALYDQFLLELLDKLSRESKDFWVEVNHFKNVLADVSNFCNGETKASTEGMVVHSSPWNDVFTVSAEDCTWMRLGPVSSVDKLRSRK